MKERIKQVLTVALLAVLCMCWNMNACAEGLGNPLDLEPIHMFSDPYSEEPGIQFFTETNEMLPELSEGHHEKWIDRVVLTEDERNVYELLVEGSDNDGVEDFLIDPDSSSLIVGLKESVSGDGNLTAVRGVKIGSVRGEGADWDIAGANISNNFMEKYYKYRTAYEAFDRDHSEVFWINNSNYISMPEYSYFYEKDPATGKNICVYTADVYFMIESEGHQWNIWHEKYREADVIRTEIAALDAKIQNIADVVKDENPVKQMKYFNEWLTKNNEYNHLVGYGRIDLSTAVQQIPDSFECTAALSGWTGDAGPVCESYARAFKMLCDYVGIPCVLVDGVAYNGAGSENHMWNYAEAEGKWYAVDCTWNDPLGGNAGAVSGYECETYFLIGSQTETHVGNSKMKFIESHPENNRLFTDGVRFINGPELNATAYVPSIQSVTLTAEKETVSLGYSEEILLTAEVEIADVPETDLHYEWYQVDANGGETLLEGENGSQFKFPVGKNAGTYTYRVKVSYEGSTGQADVEIVVRSSVADIFSDVKAGAWYTPYVQFVYDQGLMSGSKGAFNPNTSVSRAVVVTTLYRLAGSPEVTDYRACEELVDVQKGAWYTNAVCWAYNTGVTTGDTTTKKFNMDSLVTRQQLAAFFYRYAEVSGRDITIRGDISKMLNADQVKSYAKDAVEWSVGTGIINGKDVYDSNGKEAKDLAPLDGATRAQLAAMLQRYCDLDVL